MEITGKIVKVLDARTGISQKDGSTWVCQSFVLQTQDMYVKHMCFDVFGSDKLQQMNLQSGAVYTVHFDIDARESKDGRWFNSIRAYKAELVSGGAVAQQPMQQGTQQQQNPFAQPTPPFGAQSPANNNPFANYEQQQNNGQPPF